MTESLVMETIVSAEIRSQQFPKLVKSVSLTPIRSVRLCSLIYRSKGKLIPVLN
jgi:hypothetical protein